MLNEPNFTRTCSLMGYPANRYMVTNLIDYNKTDKDLQYIQSNVGCDLVATLYALHAIDYDYDRVPELVVNPSKHFNIHFDEINSSRTIEDTVHISKPKFVESGYVTTVLQEVLRNNPTKFEYKFMIDGHAGYLEWMDRNVCGDYKVNPWNRIVDVIYNVLDIGVVNPELKIKPKFNINNYRIVEVNTKFKQPERLIELETFKLQYRDCDAPTLLEIKNNILALTDQRWIDVLRTRDIKVAKPKPKTPPTPKRKVNMTFQNINFEKRIRKAVHSVYPECTRESMSNILDDIAVKLVGKSTDKEKERIANIKPVAPPAPTFIELVQAKLDLLFPPQFKVKIIKRGDLYKVNLKLNTSLVQVIFKQEVNEGFNVNEFIESLRKDVMVVSKNSVFVAGTGLLFACDECGSVTHTNVCSECAGNPIVIK
jgi:hypothetical protein